MTIKDGSGSDRLRIANNLARTLGAEVELDAPDEYTRILVNRLKKARTEDPAPTRAAPRKT